VCDTLAQHAADIPIVLDPVMVATSGARLLADDAVAMLRDRLLPMACVITPNVPEAEALTGMDIPNVAMMHRAASRLLTLGAPAVLLKGGHLHGEHVVDLLATADGVEDFIAPRIESRHTHGTGCTLASGVAAGLAQGLVMRDAVQRARDYVRAAIETAPGFGAGHGPLNHAVGVNTG
jgi:hydroxymethylpyrimidine/phosphomethylpyrimidine kinase